MCKTKKLIHHTRGELYWLFVIGTLMLLLFVSRVATAAEVLERRASLKSVLPDAAGPRLGIIFVLEVVITDRAELDELVRCNYDVSNVRDGVVTIYATQGELDALIEAGYQPREIGRQPVYKPGEKPGATGLGVYHNYGTLSSELQDYAVAHPDICRLISLGQSVQGRELWALKITDNPDVEEEEPEFKYISTMHGNEPVGLELCLYFLDLLLNEYGTDSRITGLVDSTEIWMVPCMNPDGLELGTRYNANGYDLNRNFPEYTLGEQNTTAGRQPEVVQVMNWSQQHSFILAASLHGGALVVNYPYDNDGKGSVDSPTPDDLLLEDVSRRYSYYNSPMWNSLIFPDGISNGAAWYAINGGMTDWNYRWLSNNEVVVELSNIKTPPQSQLPAFWNDNEESMLSYLEAVHIGVRGVVRDRYTSRPLAATVWVEGNSHPVYTDPDLGDYYRMLLPGIYSLRYEAPGYLPLTVTDVEVIDEPATRVDVQLHPEPSATDHSWTSYR